MKKFIEENAGRLKIFHLQPYSPELNPDEFVWNDVKSHGVGRSEIQTQEDLKSAAVGRLGHLQKNPEKVRSFFRAKHTSYAA